MHKSVLLNECLENLNIKENSIIVDATLGYAGHSSNILKKLSNGFLYAFDQDIEAIESSIKRLDEISSNYKIIKSNFVNLKKELNEIGVDKVDGILFDLGVSSPQLDNDYRGFSFHNDAVLDMRMDTNQELDAKKVVNEYSYHDLVKIFRNYGEEEYATSIARKIESSRIIEPIITTLQLVEIIKSSVPEKYKRDKHPARKVFQAIRIEVNKELDVFKKALDDALELIDVGGRVCVITFHSLEDKICKSRFKELSEIDKSLKNLPIIPLEYQPKYKIIGTFEPSALELTENPRSRSARLRVIERTRR